MCQSTTSPSFSSPYPLTSTKLTGNYVVLTILLSGQTQVKSAESSGTTVGAHPDIHRVYTHMHKHTENEYINLISGNMAKQMKAKRWSRELYSVVKQGVLPVWMGELVGCFGFWGFFFLFGFLVFYEQIGLGHFILFALRQQDVFNTHTFIDSTAYVGSYQSSSISHFNSRFLVKTAVYKYNNLNCFIQPMNVINCNFHASVFYNVIITATFEQ